MDAGVASTSAVAIAEAARDVRGYPVNFEAARIAPMIAAVALHARRALGTGEFRPFLDLVDVFPECLSHTARFRWIVGAVELSIGRNFAATARHLRGRLPVKLVSDHDIAVYRAVEGRASVLWALRPGGAAGNGPTAAPLAEAIDWAAHVDRTKPALSSADLARRNTVRNSSSAGGGCCWASERAPFATARLCSRHHVSFHGTRTDGLASWCDFRRNT